MQKPKRGRPRKPQSSKPRPKYPTRTMEPLPLLAFTIPEFCRAHSFSPALYWKLKSQGLGPVEMKVGKRILISMDAVTNWQRQREIRAP